MGSSCVDLGVELGGLKLKNPLVLASGILGTSPGLLKRVEEAGAAAVVTKTVTLAPRSGYSNPVIVELEQGFLNAMGLPNPGAEYFASKVLTKAVRELRVPVILSISPADPEEAYRMTLLGAKAGAGGIEINLSCPHVSGLGVSLSRSLELVEDIVKASRRGAGEIPIFVKLSAEQDYVTVARIALESGASGIVAINTIRAVAIDVYAKAPILSNVYGGLSGPAIKPIAVRVVWELYEELGPVPIVGVGGVCSWEDAVELMLAGASAVGVGTGVAIKGLTIFAEILSGIESFLAEEGFTAVREIVGLAHKNV